MSHEWVEFCLIHRFHAFHDDIGNNAAMWGRILLLPLLQSLHHSIRFRSFPRLELRVPSFPPYRFIALALYRTNDGRRIADTDQLKTAPRRLIACFRMKSAFLSTVHVKVNATNTSSISGWYGRGGLLFSLFPVPLSVQLLCNIFTEGICIINEHLGPPPLQSSVNVKARKSVPQVRLSNTFYWCRRMI